MTLNIRQVVYSLRSLYLPMASQQCNLDLPLTIRLSVILHLQSNLSSEQRHLSRKHTLLMHSHKHLAEPQRSEPSSSSAPGPLRASHKRAHRTRPRGPPHPSSPSKQKCDRQQTRLSRACRNQYRAHLGSWEQPDWLHRAAPRNGGPGNAVAEIDNPAFMREMD